jgi:hypothetical protein
MPFCQRAGSCSSRRRSGRGFLMRGNEFRILHSSGCSPRTLPKGAPYRQWGRIGSAVRQLFRIPAFQGPTHLALRRSERGRMAPRESGDLETWEPEDLPSSHSARSRWTSHGNDRPEVAVEILGKQMFSLTRADAGHARPSPPHRRDRCGRASIRTGGRRATAKSTARRTERHRREA